MEGYDTAVLGNALGLPQYRKKFGHEYRKPDGSLDWQLTAPWQMAVQQAPTIGCVFGIFLASWMQDKYGYRPTLQINLVLITGILFIIFFAKSVEMLFIGELLAGIPWGAFSSSAVSYASDVTPVPLRGYLTTYVNLCWIFGQIIAAGVLKGTLSIEGDLAFRIPFAVQWFWPIPLMVIITLAPESPWYLVRKGRLADAERAVARLSSRKENVDPAKTVAMMVRTNQLEIDADVGSQFWDCFRGADARRTEICCIGWVCQVFCGMALVGNAVYFFQQAGLNDSDAFSLNLGTTFMAMVGTLLSWVCLTYGGRRPFFVGGLAFMFTILIIIGGLAWKADSDSAVKYAQAALVMIAVFTYDLTVGPLTYCIVGETSATRLRSKTVGLARIAYNIAGVVAGILNTYMMNPTAFNWRTRSALFWAGTCLLCCIWAYFRLPECKGRSYRELDILFERRTKTRQFKSTVISEEDDE